MPPKKAAGKGKGPSKAQQNEIYMLTSAKMAYTAACKVAQLQPHEQLVNGIRDRIDISGKEGAPMMGKPLQKLCFREDGMGPTALRAICDGVAGYPGLLNLCFWRCNLGDEGLGALADLLTFGATDPRNRACRLRLVELTADGGGRHDPAASRDPYAVEPGVCALDDDALSSLWARDPRGPLGAVEGPHPAFGLDALHRLAGAVGLPGATLRVLVLDHNDVGDSGTAVLCRGLATCGSLRTLSLANNGIGVVGAAAVAELLQPPPRAAPGVEGTPSPLPPKSTCPQLEALSLARNALGGDGVAVLALRLPACTSLRSLNLASVGLTFDYHPAVELLAEALLHSPGLTAVDLDGNQVGAVGALCFLPALTANTDLLQFRVSADLRDPATGLIARDALKQLTAVLATHKPKKKKRGGKKKSS